MSLLRVGSGHVRGFLIRARRNLLGPRVAPITGREVPVFPGRVLQNAVLPEPRPGIKPCCQQRSNLMTWAPSSDLRVSVCQQCGCRHFRMAADPGLFATSGANAMLGA